ncbi:hypothetical protein EDD37DRAFT_646938 [Exophiala viscosa]|uniref:Zn(2)-C6 fungal-type domain-containing protein n=1 Tax=Exophiala viscosa TaxID=2486360 RepID=A0AAN6E6S7_9EURO|nr:hypothetical protein EDD36DRAFT_470578 [Exophiala viscosa]KAI1627251.1 hypothetical protein EDD37DRAFT_646938 [Exophiala viscosa]
MSSPASSHNEAKPLMPTSKQQKLKYACDACARRKISCPKQQPECERCVSRGRRCTYSPACRHGKRKATARDPTTKTLSSPSECRSEPTPSPLASPENEDPFTTGTMNHSPTTFGGVPPELITDNMSARPWSMTSDLSFTASRLQEALGQSTDPTVTIVEPSETLLNPNYPYQELSMFHGYSEANSFPSYVPAFTWPLQQTPPPWTSASSNTRGSSSSSSESSSWSAPASACSSSSLTADIEAALLVDQALPQLHTRQESCFTRTYSLLQTLRRPSGKVCVFESADMPSPSFRPNTVSDSVDRILLKTDKAIEHVTSVMKCECHTTSSVRCALTLALFEVISWYETIVRALNLPRAEKATEERSPSVSTDEDYDSRCTTSPEEQDEWDDSEYSETVSIPTVSIGDMRLPGADARSILGSLVRARIGKVRGMVQAMSADCSRSLLDVAKMDTVMAACVRSAQWKDDATTLS